MRFNAKQIVITITLIFALANTAGAQTKRTQSDVSYDIAQSKMRITTSQLPRLGRLRNQSNGSLLSSVDLTVAELIKILDSATQLQILADFYNSSKPNNRAMALAYIDIAFLTINPKSDSLETIASYNVNEELRNIIEILQNERFYLFLAGWRLQELIKN
jgi:hypothetical protein